VRKECTWVHTISVGPPEMIGKKMTMKATDIEHIDYGQCSVRKLALSTQTMAGCCIETYNVEVEDARVPPLAGQHEQSHHLMRDRGQKEKWWMNW
jgi:hypothetical protein